MSQTSAPDVRTFQQTLTGTPAALAIPANIEPAEIWIQSSATINEYGVDQQTGTVDSVAFPLAASTVHRLTYNRAAAARFAGSAAAQVKVVGNYRKA